MPMIRINAGASGLERHAARANLTETLFQGLDGDGPVIVMIHGYKYRPGHRHACPHRTIFARDASRGSAAWPRHLGFGLGLPQEGLGIAFGWDARGHLPLVYRRAQESGRHLAELLCRIRAIAPRREVHILSHSLGSEVAFEALQHVPAGTVRRLLCLTAASYRSTAQRAMESPAGRTAELVNVTSRENDVFDFMFEWLVPAAALGDRALGQGLEARNIVTLQLDHPDHLQALARLGSHIAPPARRICHWSGYLRPGVLRVWARIMRHPDQLPLHLLAPTPPAPRWSRLMVSLRRSALLPSGAKPAT